MSITSELWKLKESPRWLLEASRSCAQYPSARNINMRALTQYVHQFAHGIPVNVQESAFFEALHAGHQAFFRFFAQDAADFFNVFKGAYGSELVQQARHFTGKAEYAYLNPERLTPNTAANLMTSSLMGAVRDMSVLDSLHLKGLISAEEKTFGLQEIHRRMDRLGVHGVDRLFAVRPELEEFVQNDPTVIDVSHFADQPKNWKQTRASLYRDKADRVKGFSFEADSMTNLRENIISPTFAERRKALEHYIGLHIHDVPPPSVQARQHFANEGVVLKSGSPDVIHPQYEATVEKLVHGAERGDAAALEQFQHFMIHDGVAINDPRAQEKYIASLRNRMAGIVDEDVYLSTKHIEPIAPEAPIVIENARDPSLPPSEHRDLVVIPKEPQVHGSVSDNMQNNAIEDAVVIGESQRAPLTYNAESNTAAKIATIGGAVAAIGLLATEGKNSGHPSDGVKGTETLSKNGKRVVFGAATSVAAGGAIMWSRKPDFLFKPLQRLCAKLFGKGERGL